MDNSKVKNIVILIHGIRSPIRGNWIKKFKIRFEDDNRFKDWVCLKARYGFLFAVLCIIPFVRYSLIRWFMRHLRKIQKQYPNAILNVVSHSYGTMLAYEAIRRSGKQPIKVNKIIFIGGIVSSHEKFDDTIGIGLLNELHNFCSYKDKIARFAPFGHCGFNGFLKDRKDRQYYKKPYENLEIYNHRYEVRHSEWFDSKPPDFYRMFRDILKGVNHD